MAKKSFSAGVTKTGVLDNAGGAKIKEIQAKAQYNFQYIAKEKIQSNPKNEKYTQDGIESLMESILVNGLRHNLSVLYDADQDKYRLISGERRYRAICMMNDKDYNTLFPMGIPCKIEKANIDDIDEEIMLISAIPYITLFFEACTEGNFIDFMLKAKTIADEADNNSIFIKEIKTLNENIMFKLQELQLKM